MIDQDGTIFSMKTCASNWGIPFANKKHPVRWHRTIDDLVRTVYWHLKECEKNGKPMDEAMKDVIRMFESAEGV